MTQELPEFEVQGNSGIPLNDLFAQISAGTVAPSNSLLASSLETMSYKANALLQEHNSAAPNIEDLMKAIMQN